MSQNLMYSHLSISDGISGILSADDLQERKENIGKVSATKKQEIKEEIKRYLLELISNIKIHIRVVP